jgi:hypothetical protein
MKSGSTEKLPSFEGDCPEYDCDGTGFLTFVSFYWYICFFLLFTGLLISILCVFASTVDALVQRKRRCTEVKISSEQSGQSATEARNESAAVVNKVEQHVQSVKETPVCDIPLSQPVQSVKETPVCESALSQPVQSVSLGHMVFGKSLCSNNISSNEVKIRNEVVGSKEGRINVLPLFSIFLLFLLVA